MNQHPSPSAPEERYHKIPPVHLDQLLRYCGAATKVIGQSSVFGNGKLVAVEGDKDTHNMMGDLIQQYGAGNIFVEGKKLIVAMGDKAAPDQIGMVRHPYMPTDPKEGSQNIFAYNGLAGGGLGNILGGKLNIGELVKVGSQLMGQVKSFTDNGNGTGFAVLQNMGSSTPQAGDTLVGQDSGNSLILTNFVRSNDFDGPTFAPTFTDDFITDDVGAIAVDSYFTGSPSQDYNSDYLVRDDS